MSAKTHLFDIQRSMAVAQRSKSERKFDERLRFLRSASLAEILETMSPPRREVWDITDGLCFYCGIELRPYPEAKHIGLREFAVEHYIPKSKTGGCENNLFPACPNCNNSKSNKKISEWRQFLSIRSQFADAPYFSKDQKRWLLENGFSKFHDAETAPATHVFWAEKNGWLLTDKCATKINEVAN